MFGLYGFDLIPSIYCEALELLRIPFLNLDPISKKIESNTHSLHNLVSKIERLETQISSCLETTDNNVKLLNTYADITSSFVPLHPVSASLSPNSYSRVVLKCTLSSEHCECILSPSLVCLIIDNLLKLRSLLMRCLNFLSVGQFG